MWQTSPYVKTMRLVGLIGAKQSGKSTLATALVNQHGFTRLSMAQPLRNMLLAMGLAQEDLTDPVRKEAPHPLLGGKSPRHALQTLGTEWGRNLIDPDVWIKAMELEIQRRSNDNATAAFVIDDIRFPNEAHLIQRLNGQLWRIRRPAAEDSGDLHASEEYWQTLPYDHELHNIADVPTLIEYAVKLLQNSIPRVPRWLSVANSRIGIKEIRGPFHNSIIMEWIAKLTPKRLGMRILDDETPWCGVFLASVMLDSGIEPPAVAARALSWATWGKAIPFPILGAVVVFRRLGGGHVGLYVGEDESAFHILGGNQSNSVNISRIEKSRCVAVRWPDTELVYGNRVLLSKSGKPVSTNEA